MSIKNYDINEHMHRFSAWAAARAAMTSKKCRFTVKQGVEILEAAGLDANYTFDRLDKALESKSFDTLHSELREKAVRFAIHEKKLDAFTHGVAAKLINIYFKAKFGSVTGTVTGSIHPPIDRILLDGLIQHSKASPTDIAVWKNVNAKWGGWSGLNSLQYQDVINSIRRYCNGQPLWMVESFWAGHQDN
ncbi:MAG: hypothetical protein PHP85_12205 [Gallionella sp.]|nr:hypothetical protein [Gallionella sp.]